MDGITLRLTGAPLDHCPNRQFKITSHRWSIGTLSICTVRFRKFGRSKLRHSDQGRLKERKSRRKGKKEMQGKSGTDTD